MNSCHIDHLVITAPSLKDGVAYVQQTLGVSMQQGGEHTAMGTHNCLLKLGDALYLEVIAINPQAAKPKHARWFGLDNLTANAKPVLTVWVAATDNIHAAVSSCLQSPGIIESMGRGAFNWLLSIPGDGRLVYAGVAPMFIQWLSEKHPCNMLPDAGCSLIQLEGFHPKAAEINQLLTHINFNGNFKVYAAASYNDIALAALIQTPNGVRKL